MSKLLATIIESIYPFGKEDSVKNSGISFRMSTKWTAGVISVCVCIILMNRFYGDAIECFPSDAKYRGAMTLKCWMEGVYLDKSLMDQNLNLSDHLIKHGVGINNNLDKPIEKITYMYYQWIIPLLLFQAFIFQLPNTLWYSCEKKVMQKLLGKVSFPIFSADWEKQRKTLITYVKDVKEKYHQEYAFKYLMCEIFAFFVIVFNMQLMKKVIQHEAGNFLSGYGNAVRSFITGDINQFLFDASLFFPTQAKCDFNIYGSSGSLQSRDALCILPQNVIIDKIFVFLYIWYAIILICSICSLVYYIALFVCKIFRIFDIGYMLERNVSIREVRAISSNGSIGKWFVFTMYRRNLMSIQFQDFCKELQKELKLEIIKDAPRKADLEKVATSSGSGDV